MADKPTETMAEQWQRVMPADFANGTDFALRVGRIDTKCMFDLVEAARSVGALARRSSDRGSIVSGTADALTLGLPAS